MEKTETSIMDEKESHIENEMLVENNEEKEVVENMTSSNSSDVHIETENAVGLQENGEANESSHLQSNNGTESLHSNRPLDDHMEMSVNDIVAKTQSILRSVGATIQNTSIVTPEIPKENKAKSLKAKFLDRLNKKKQVQSTVRVMSVDEVYQQNQKVQSREEQKKKEDEEKRKQLFPERVITVEKPIETAHEFLQKEGPSRLFTVPKLTKTDELSSDDDLQIVDSVDPALNSMSNFKSSLKDIRTHQRYADAKEIEAIYKKSTQATRAIRSQLERSASSLRKAREELCNEMKFTVQKAAIDEERKIVELNRQFQEIYEKKPEEENIPQEVMPDQEEQMDSKDDLFDDEADDEEELKKRKYRSITVLSEDEEEGEHKIKPVVEPPKPQASELLVMNKDGKLIKEKAKVSLMDMFKKAKERKQVVEQPEESSSEIEPEEIPSEKEEPDEEDNKEDSQLSEDEMVDENRYEGDIQPTAEDYERYKQMMSETRRVKNALVDDEAEESGSDVNSDDDVEKEGDLVIPEGIDIVERPMSEREKNSIIHFHNRLKEQEDEEQVEFVKKGIKEGSQYIRRQMRRNRVNYNAYSEDENDTRKVVVAAMGEDDESDEENEEEMYLKQIRREELYRKMTGQTTMEDSEEEEEEEESEESDDDGEKFDSEEEREMEQFKKRIEQKRELERAKSVHSTLSPIVTFDNPEISNFLQSSSSFSVTPSTNSNTCLKRTSSTNSRQLIRQKSLSKTPSILPDTVLNSLSRSNTKSNSTTISNKTSFLFTSSDQPHTNKESTSTLPKSSLKRSTTVRLDSHESASKQSR